jgi:integrase
VRKQPPVGQNSDDLSEKNRDVSPAARAGRSGDELHEDKAAAELLKLERAEKDWLDYLVAFFAFIASLGAIAAALVASYQGWVARDTEKRQLRAYVFLESVKTDAPKAKHLVKAGNRFTKISEHAAAALRLLLFTGARLREILHLKWENVDLERGLLFLADSKTGRKTLVLNAPAMAVLVSLPRVGSYVIASDTAGTKGEKPRADLKRPWQTIAKRAGLDGVRLHDLRHTYASFGAGGGLGLPIIGKLLGHTQASTTQRYAHLDNDPLRLATESIGSRIAAALDGKRGATVVAMKERRR